MNHLPPSQPPRTALPLLLALLASGCATLADPGQPLLPTRNHVRTGPFEVYTAHPLGDNLAPVRNLLDLEQDLARTLALRANPAASPVEVYVLSNREAFTHFLTFYYPDLPPRRAFFLAQGDKRTIYTYTNDRLDEDLRHEGTHALLHATVGDLPLWLDEGLAEFFEGPGDRRGLNPEHLTRLQIDRKQGWKPDLARLEALKSIKDMTPRDYRESWAWAHLLLDPREPANKPALLAYLDDVRAAGEAPAPLSERLRKLGPDPERRLLAHLEQAAAAPVAAAPAPKVLLQSAVEPEPAPAPAPRRGPFARFLGLFGLGDRKP